MQTKTIPRRPDCELRDAARDLREAGFAYDGLYGDDFLREIERIAAMAVRPEPKRAARVRRLKYREGPSRHFKTPLSVISLAS